MSIVFEAWTNTGYFSASGSASVKNAALLYGRMEFEQGVNPMEHGVPSGVETLGPLNYGLYVATTTPWGWQEMRADLMHCNVFYVNTHSNLSAPWGFWTDRNEASTPVWELIVPWHSLDPVLNMEDAVYEKVGSGIPPFNANQPPFNLVWIDACHTGEDNEFAKAFLWPYINAYNNRWAENQSELGYRIESSTICASASASAFWSALADGWSAYQARIELHSAYRQIDPTCPATPEELIALWGDFAARLHNVYLEDFSVQSTFWKIP